MNVKGANSIQEEGYAPRNGNDLVTTMIEESKDIYTKQKPDMQTMGSNQLEDYTGYVITVQYSEKLSREDLD